MPTVTSAPRILVVDDEEAHEAFAEKPVTLKGLLEAVSLLLFGHTRGPR